MRKRLWLAVFQRALDAAQPAQGGPGITEEVITNAINCANRAYDGILAKFPLPERTQNPPVQVPTPLGEDQP